MMFILIFAAVLLITIVIYIRGELTAEEKNAPLQKLSEEIEFYDYWAVFAKDDNLTLSGDDSAICESIDCRILPYAEKMIEEKLINCESPSWLEHNSWRYGFIFHGEPSDFRYVGVFPAEQMYYSGLTLDDYIRLIEIEGREGN